MAVVSEVSHYDAPLRPLGGRASELRVLRPVTFLAMIVWIAVTGFLILQCIRAIECVSGSSPDGKRLLAGVGGEHECTREASSPATQEEAEDMTGKVKALSEKLQELEEPADGDLGELATRVQAAKEVCKDLERFTEFGPIKKAELKEPLAALEARATETEEKTRDLVDGLVELWKSRLSSVLEVVEAGTSSEDDLQEVKQDAELAVDAIKNASGFDQQASGVGPTAGQAIGACSFVGLCLRHEISPFSCCFLFLDAMRVFAASLLTAAAVAFLLEGGSAAAPKAFLEVGSAAASLPKVEHVESRHKNAPAGSQRRGELRKKFFLSALVAGLSSLALLFLVMQCTRSLSQLNSSLAGQQRLLAEGGVDPACGAEAPGGEDPIPGQEISPSTLAGKVAVQRNILHLSEEDRNLLTPDELLKVLEAQKNLQATRDMVDAAHDRLVEAEQELTRFHHTMLVKGVAPATRIQAALGKLEEKKATFQKRHIMQRNLLAAMAYQPSQARRAFLKWVDGQSTGRSLPKSVAEAVTAAETVLNPGKVFVDVPSSSQTLKLLEMTDALRAEIEELVKELKGVGETPRRIDPSAAKPMAHALSLKAERFRRKLLAVGMVETAGALHGAMDVLAEASNLGASAPGPLLSLDFLEEAFAGLALSEKQKRGPKEMEQELEGVKYDERILLSTSKAAAKAASVIPGDDEGWMSLHRRFVELASAFTVSGRRKVSPQVPEEARQAYVVAVSMCQFSLERLGRHMGTFWKRKTQDLDAQLLGALTDMLRAERNLAGTLPNDDGNESRIIGVARNCRECLVSAMRWHKEIKPLEQAHPLVHDIVGGDVTHLRATASSADQAVGRGLDLHAERLAAMAGDELLRLQSVAPGGLSFLDGLRVQNFLEIAQADWAKMRDFLEDLPAPLSFLEAKLRALESAFAKHMDFLQGSAGSAREKLSKRLFRGGDKE
ncbi:hypothetical protein ACSSS7_006135 [Eimeria intestinalis]